MGFLSEFLNEFKSFGKVQTYKSIGMGALGASGHALYPTLVEAVFKTDLSGYRGLFTAIGMNTVTGCILKSPEYLIGAYSAAVLHFWYGRLNGWVVYPVLNQHLFRFNPIDETSAMSDNLPDNAQLQPGAKIVEIGGRKVQVFDRQDVKTEIANQAASPTVAGYGTAAPGSIRQEEAVAPTVQGYGTATPGKILNNGQLSGFGTATQGRVRSNPNRTSRLDGAGSRAKFEISRLG